MSARSNKGKDRAGATSMTIAKLRRIGAFNGGGSAEDCLRRDLKVAELTVDYLMPLARTGNKVREGSAGGNVGRIKEANDLHADWQRQAALLWAQPQHAKKSVSDIARLVDPKRWNTVRHHISRRDK